MSERVEVRTKRKEGGRKIQSSRMRESDKMLISSNLVELESNSGF